MHGVQTHCRAHPVNCSEGNKGFFSWGVQWYGHEADLLPVLRMHGAVLPVLYIYLYHDALSSTGSCYHCD